MFKQDPRILRDLDELICTAKEKYGTQFHHFYIPFTLVYKEEYETNEQDPDAFNAKVYVCDSQPKHALAEPIYYTYNNDDVSELLEFLSKVTRDPDIRICVMLTPTPVLTIFATEDFPYTVELSADVLTLENFGKALLNGWDLHRWCTRAPLAIRGQFYITPSISGSREEIPPESWAQNQRNEVQSQPELKAPWKPRPHPNAVEIQLDMKDTPTPIPTQDSEKLPPEMEEMLKTVQADVARISTPEGLAKSEELMKQTSKKLDEIFEGFQGEAARDIDVELRRRLNAAQAVEQEKENFIKAEPQGQVIQVSAGVPDGDDLEFEAPAGYQATVPADMSDPLTSAIEQFNQMGLSDQQEVRKCLQDEGIVPSAPIVSLVNLLLTLGPSTKKKFLDATRGLENLPQLK